MKQKTKKGVLETNFNHDLPAHPLFVRVCFPGLDWNFSENAVCVMSAWVCLSALGVSVWNVSVCYILLTWISALLLCANVLCMCIRSDAWKSTVTM